MTNPAPTPAPAVITVTALKTWLLSGLLLAARRSRALGARNAREHKADPVFLRRLYSEDFAFRVRGERFSLPPEWLNSPEERAEAEAVIKAGRSPVTSGRLLVPEHGYAILGPDGAPLS